MSQKTLCEYCQKPADAKRPWHWYHVEVALVSDPRERPEYAMYDLCSVGCLRQWAARQK